MHNQQAELNQIQYPIGRCKKYAHNLYSTKLYQSIFCSSKRSTHSSALGP